MARSITSSNATLLLAVAGVFDTAIQLQNFSTDDIYDFDDMEPIETQMSVDGFLSGGYVPVPVVQAINLMANSTSGFIFDQWFAAQKATGDIFTASGTLILKSIGRKYIQTGGFLSGYKPVPGGGKTLKARKFGIRWESVVPQNV